MKLTLILLIFAVSTLSGCAYWKNQTPPKRLGLNEDNQFAPMPESPNAVSSQTSIESHYVAPIAFSSSAQTVQKQIVAALRKMPNSQLVTVLPHYIHVTFTSTLWRFIDDVEIYIDTQHHLIHYRSQSRLGYSDFGVNRARYQLFVEQLAQQQ
ncbi:hypothetical protein VST7929_03249 [Vibrio stylophorae]|uniref:DUF1499 domain-containing protein n=1 Tax=Vibrio stylophorae TaxID=659351 RepID=A0ABN8DZH5_9VIBR|nr:DUF1499 domain-containing protein [Vibrio stylophorae]CAH0535775.1 hypothetical protein VST7929_03249 [Vibrio stylophorae]